MIETTILNHLNAMMSVPATTEREEEPPEEYVLIERTGGSLENWIRTATIAVQTYADSMYRAAALAEEALAAMLSLTTLGAISSVKLNAGPYNFTDIAEKKYRYQAIFDLVYYPEMTDEE